MKAIYRILKMSWLSFLFCSTSMHAQFAGNLAMDGNTQTVITPNGMMNASTVFTIEFWVKTTESRTNATYWQRPTMFGSASSGAPSGDFGITTNNGYIGMWSGLNNGGDNDFLSTTLQVNDNNWHHIAAVNNGVTIQLFVDGSLTGSITSGIGLFTNGCPLTIGGASLNFSWTGNGGANTNFWHQGIYDEVRISNNVRYTSNFTVPSTPFVSDINTVALYHFDGCITSNNVPDAGVNNNTAFAINFLSGNCSLQLPSVPDINTNPAIPNVVKAEYFIDTDPGIGNGTDISVAAANNITVTNVAVNLTGINDGAHFLYVRTKDAAGKWGHTNKSVFLIVPVLPVINSNPVIANVTKAEYFIDTDPGMGNGTDIPVTASGNVTVSNAVVNLTGITSGAHQLFIRTRNAIGYWSLTNRVIFLVLPVVPGINANPAVPAVTQAEYFIDTDPGFGNGTNVPLSPGTDVTVSNAVVNLSGLTNGAHQIFLRTKDANGKWGTTNARLFNIVVATVNIPPNPVPGNIVKFEYFFDTDPGFGNGTSISIAPTTNLSNYTFAADISGLSNGAHTLYIRSFDGWSLTTAQNFTIGNPLSVGLLTFSGQKNGHQVDLQWKTSVEQKVISFEVERSADGTNFQNIGKVAAGQYTDHHYQFTDLAPLDNANYYRLKEINQNGSVNFSQVIKVLFFADRDDEIVLFPNPASDLLNIRVASQGKIYVSVTDSRGSAVLSQLTDAPNLQMNIGQLPAGKYWLRITDGQGIRTKSFIKE